MQIGFIGTGTMGNAMSRSLIEAGYQLTVYDLNRAATTNLCELGARWVDTPRAVAEASQVVFTSLPGPAEVWEVALDSETGILAGLAKGGTYIDTTTNSPTVWQEVSDRCLDAGIEVLDAPVSGRPPDMSVMVGGDRQIFDKHQPLLKSIGRDVIYVGESGSGCKAKLVNQYLGFTNYVAAIEGLIIGAKAGLDLNILARIISVSSGASKTFEAIPDGVFDGEFKAEGTVDIIAKDLGLACELARNLQAPSAMGLAAEDVFKRGQAQGLGGLGYHAATQVLEQVAGAKLRAL